MILRTRLRLEGHLRSEDFFGVDKNQSSSIKIGESSTTGPKQEVTAELTIKGITKEFPVMINLEPNGQMISISTVLEVDRTEYGIRYKSKKFDALLDNFIDDYFEIKTNLVATK